MVLLPDDCLPRSMVLNLVPSVVPEERGDALLRVSCFHLLYSYSEHRMKTTILTYAAGLLALTSTFVSAQSTKSAIGEACSYVVLFDEL